MFSATFFQIQNAAILGLMFWGLKVRRNKNQHIPIMLSAIVWDIFLVLQIELSRHAIATAVKVITNPLILTIHISLAVFVVILYFPIIFYGRKLKKGPAAYDNAQFARLKVVHKNLGLTAFVVRILVFVTSFFAHQPAPLAS